VLFCSRIWTFGGSLRIGRASTTALSAAASASAQYFASSGDKAERGDGNPISAARSGSWDTNGEALDQPVAKIVASEGKVVMIPSEDLRVAVLLEREVRVARWTVRSSPLWRLSSNVLFL